MTSTDMISLDVSDDAVFLEALVKVPRVAYFWVRAYFETCAKIHRDTFRTRSRGNVDFRGSGSDKAVRVYELNQQPEGGRDHWIVYHLSGEKRIADERDFPDAITLDIYSRSQLAAQMQKDRAIRPRRVSKLAIPLELKSYGGFGHTNVSWGDRSRNRPWPFIYRRLNPSAVLLAKPSKRTGKLILYERVRMRVGTRRRLRVGKKGQVLKAQPKVWVDTLVPKWALVDLLVLKRSMLHFYESWDSMQPVFDRVYNSYTQKIGQDIERGVDS